MISVEDFTLNDIAQALEGDWKEYVNLFEALSPDTQADFLQKQGFDSFHDLLAHIVGWWEEGLWIITGIMDNPSFTWKERDVDSFNQELVKKYRPWKDQDLLLHFENVRNATLDLVSELNDDALMNEDIRDWFHGNMIEHLEDHKIG